MGRSVRVCQKRLDTILQIKGASVHRQQHLFRKKHVPAQPPSTDTQTTMSIRKMSLAFLVGSESDTSSSSTTASLDSLAHAAAAMSNQEGAHRCSRCASCFTQKVRFLHHLRAQHGVREYENREILPCPTCPAAFLRNTDRVKHVACVHEKSRPHACKVAGCGSAFFFAKDLAKHNSTVHLRHRPYACKTCDKHFGKREHMTSHVKRVHEQLRPFKCDVCGIKLASKYNLQGHLKTNSHAQAMANLRQSGSSSGSKNGGSRSRERDERWGGRASRDGRGRSGRDREDGSSLVSGLLARTRL